MFGQACRASCHCQEFSARHNLDGLGRNRLTSEVRSRGGVLYAMLHKLKKQKAMSFVRALASSRIQVSQSTA